MAELDQSARARSDAENGSTTALLGEVFNGRYRVLRVIGEGGLGRVYQVEHAHVGRRYALKVLKEEHRGSPSAVARFRQEARVGGRLDSPWTVAVTDYDVWRGIPYLVMEYLEGETLHALLSREGALPVERVVSLVLDACRGVRAAHELGIFHRDLKPANLFVCSGPDREHCKVLDFGVAKLRAGEDLTSAPPITSTGGIVGTLAYMPPEQIRGEEPDAASDVYSLGVILYECLSGLRPFDANTPHALMYQILEERPPPLATSRPELPSALVRTVASALRPERADRPQAVIELERVLAALLPGPVETITPATAETKRTSRPSWTLLASCTLAALSAGGALSSLLHASSAASVEPRRASAAELGTRPNPGNATAPVVVLPRTEPSTTTLAPVPATIAADGARARRTPSPARRPAATPSALASAAASAVASEKAASSVELDFGHNPYRTTP